MARRFAIALAIALALAVLPALAPPARAADPCPLLRAAADAPDVATRIAAAACEEHQLWFRPFIDADGRIAASRVREAENALLANGQPAWARVLDYWRGSGLLGRTPAAGMCEVVVPGSAPASCRAFVVDTPWSAAFVSWVMRRAQVPGYDGSGSHLDYVRRAYRDPSGSAYRVLHPLAARPARGDLLCYVRVPSRVYGFEGVMAQLAGGNGGGLAMHCDVVVATNPDGDGLAYLVGGNVFDGVTMRLLRLDATGRFAGLPLRGQDSPECTPDTPAGCNANRQDWAVLLQLRPQQELASLAPPPAWWPPAPTAPPRPQGCCVLCVVGSGVPRCPREQPPAAPEPPADGGQ